MATLIRIALCLALVVIAAAQAGAQEIGYVTLPKIPGGTTNQGVVGALSTGFLGTSSPSVLTGFRPSAVAVSEGNVYAVGTSPSGPLLIVLGNRSDGTFNAPLAVALPGLASALAVGHIDLDGSPDVVVAVEEPGPIQVFTSVFVFSGRSLLDLNELFVDAAVIPTAGRPLSIVIARLDDDAFGDIAYVTSDNLGSDVTVILSQPEDGLILGPSTTILSTPTVAPVLPGPYPQVIAAGVLNADAIADIAVATVAGIHLFTVTPDALQDADVFSTDGAPVGVVLAEVTRDNLADIIALNAGSGEVSTNVAQTDGGYGPPSRSIPVGANPISLTLMNFDNDGIPDIAVSNLPPAGMGSVSVLRGTGTGGFTSVRTFTAPGSPVLAPVAVAAGRVDPRSTSDDIVIADAAGGIAFLSAAAGYRPVPVPAGATVSALPDLTITEAVATPASVTPGGTVNVVNTVRSGLAASGPITVRFLLSGDAIPSPDDTVLGTRVVLALGANATSRETTTLTIPANTSNGQRRILVVADPANTIAETNENNNDRATGVITIVLPDLTVRTVTVTPLVIATGANASVVVVIANVAPAPGHAPATTALVYLSRNGSVQGAIPLGSVAVPALAAGGTATLTLRRPLTGLPPGRYFVVVVVDPNDQVREMRKDNNTGRSLAALLFGADPAITKLAVAPARAVPGGTVTVTETLGNAGGDGVDVAVSLALVPVIASGAPTRPDIPLSPPPAAVALGPGNTRTRVESVVLPGDLLEGDYRVRGTLNLGGLPNADGTNDSALSNVFRVALPDLVVRSVTVTPAVVGTGANASVVVIIANAAGAPANAGATTAEVYLSRNGSVEGALLLGTVPVPALVAGGTATLSLRRPVIGLSPGRYFVVVRVDPANQVREAREDNNTGRSLLTLLFGADPAITAVTVSPTRVIPGGRVTVSETLSNPGGDTVTVNLALSLVRVTTAGVATGPEIPLPPPITGISLGPLAKRLRTDSVLLPDDLADGDYRVRATLNPDGSAPDADPANDSALSNVFRVVLPDLVVRSVTVTPAVMGTGANASVVVIIANAAGAPANAGATTAEVYLSRNGSVEGALLLGTVPVPALAGGGTATLTLRRPVVGLSPGRYFVVVRVDPANQVREASEDNNTGRSLLTLLFGADPALTGLTVAPTRAIPGGVVTVSEKLGNPGGDTVSVTLALSLVPVTPAGAPAGPDIPLPAGPPITLGPASTRTRMESVTLPGDLPERDYRLRGMLNPDGASPNADAANDSLLSNIFRVVLPDLIVRSVTITPAVMGTAANASVVVVIANVAGAPASAGPTTAEVYLSRNGSVEGAVLLGTVPVPALAAGATATLTLRQPLAGLSPGRYFAVVRVDPANQVREAQEGNNLGRSATAVLVGADPTVTAVSVTPARAVPGGNVSATTTLSNPGADAVTVDLAFSLLPVTAAGAPAGPEIPLALPVQSPASAATIMGIVLPGNSKRVRTDSVPLPSDLAVGNYRLRATVNAGGTAPDADPANDSGLSNVFQTALPDWVVRTVTFTPATVGTGSNVSATGLVSSLVGGPAAVGGGTLTVVGVVANVGTVPTPATIAEIFLSSTPSVNGAMPIGTGAVPVVSAGSSTTQTWRLLLPYVPAGPYHVVVRVDGLNVSREVIETNNVGASVAKLIVSAGPVITSTPPGSARPGVLYTYDVEAADPESDRLTFRLLTSPTGMTIDGATGLIRWTPAASQLGTHQIAVRVTDPASNTADQRFTLRVDGDGIPDAGVPGNVLEIISPASGFVTTARTLDVTVRFTAGPGAPDHPGRLLRALVLTAGGLEVARADLPVPATERTHTFTLDLSAHPEGALVLQALAQGAPGLIAVSALAGVRVDRDVADGVLVGPAGGVLVAGGGALTLTVPAGALATFERISARPADAASLPALPAGVTPGAAWEFLPHGLQFAVPVDVILTLPSVAARPDGSRVSSPAFLVNGSASVVEALGDSVLRVNNLTGTRRVRGSLSHFSHLIWVQVHDISIGVTPVPSIVDVDEPFIVSVAVADNAESPLSAAVAYFDGGSSRLRRVEPSADEGPTVGLGALRPLTADSLGRDLIYRCESPGLATYRAAIRVDLEILGPITDPIHEVIAPVFCRSADMDDGTVTTPPGSPVAATMSVERRTSPPTPGAFEALLRYRLQSETPVRGEVSVRVLDVAPGRVSDPVVAAAPAGATLTRTFNDELLMDEYVFTAPVSIPGGNVPVEDVLTFDYTFLRPDDPAELVFIMTVHPLTDVSSVLSDALEYVFITFPHNDPPVIDSTPPLDAVAGGAYRYDVEATDPDGDALTYTLRGAPRGMTIDPQTGVTTWTPGDDQVGAHPIVIAVRDRGGSVTEQSWTLTVDADTDQDGVGDSVDRCGDQPCANIVILPGGGTAFCRTEKGCDGLPVCTDCTIESGRASVDCQSRTGSTCALEDDGTLSTDGGVVITLTHRMDCTNEHCTSNGDSSLCQGGGPGGCRTSWVGDAPPGCADHVCTCPVDNACDMYVDGVPSAEGRRASLRIDKVTEGGNGTFEYDIRRPGGPQLFAPTIPTRDLVGIRAVIVHAGELRLEIKERPQENWLADPPSCSDALALGPGSVTIPFVGETRCLFRSVLDLGDPGTPVVLLNERTYNVDLNAFSSTNTTTVAGSNSFAVAAKAVAVGSTNTITVAGSNGFAVVNPLTGEVVTSLLNEGPWFGAIVVRNELGNGQDAVVRYGPNGSAVNIFDPDRGEFGLTLAGRGTVLDASHAGGNPASPVIIQVGRRDVFASRVLDVGFGAFLSGPARPVASADSLPGLQLLVSAAAYDLLRLTPLGELAADSTGWVLVVTDGTPGRAYLLNPQTPFAEGVLVGEVGAGPRTVRCLQSHGMCAVVNFGSRTATIILWDGQSTATIVGHVPIDDGAVTPDLRSDGNNVAVITSGFNSNTATRTTLAPDGSVVARETRPVSSACQGPAHALWLWNTWTAVLSCNLSSSLEVLEFAGGVANNPPTASFAHVCNDLSCSFDSAASTDPDPGDTIVRRWDFGDGLTAGDVVSPEHIYEAPGIYTVRLTVTDNRGASRTTSQQVTFGDPPTIASLAPSTVTVGSGAFTLTVNGTGYTGALKVFWNGQERPTTFVGPTQLTAQIPASDVTSVGTAQVTVSRPGTGFVSQPATVRISELPAVLSVTKTGTELVTAGEEITYTLTITNTGNVPATNVLVSDALPAGTTFVGLHIASAGTCTMGGPSGDDGVLRCAGADLFPNQLLLVVFTVATSPVAPGTLTNTATARAFNPAGDESATYPSNTVVTTVNPVPPAVLTVIKLGPEAVTAGEPIGYALTITNSGTAPAANVLVSDALPAGTTLVGTATASAGTCTMGGPSGDDGVLRCAGADLVVGQSFTVAFTVATSSATPGTITNTATARAFNPAGVESDVFTSDTVTTAVNAAGS